MTLDDTTAKYVRRRRRFYVALGLFLAWLTALGVLAVTSGRRPDSVAAVNEGR
jgi:hypothetical protein